jgi:hypothetical protein
MDYTILIHQEEEGGHHLTRLGLVLLREAYPRVVCLS